MVNGMASVNVGCKQCHGSKVAIEATDGGLITVDDLVPDEDGKPTNQGTAGSHLIERQTTTADRSARQQLAEYGHRAVEPGWLAWLLFRLPLRHDFSPRRARQPENCGKCHLGPDHPQKEIYEESKHGVAFRDLKDKMNLDADDWVLGEDYTQAPTCAHLPHVRPTRETAARLPTIRANGSPGPTARRSAW